MRRRDETPDPAAVRELPALEAELGPLVAAVRPTPRPAWAAELDRRAAAGFGGSRRRLALPRLGGRMLTPALGLAACALVAIVVVAAGLSGGHHGTSTGGTSASSSGGDAATAQAPATADPLTKSAVPSDSAAGSSAETAPSGSAGAGATRAAAPGGRRIERATQLTLGVTDERMQSTANRVFAVTGDLDGIVDSSSVASGPGAPGGSTFELRFPAARVATAITRLAALGHVRSETSTTQDVTGAFVSARGRLADARAERAGILRALAKAESAGKIDALKERLRLAESRIGAAQTDIKALRAHTDYARVELTLVPQRRGAAVPPGGDRGGWDAGDALHDAGRVLAVAGGVAVVVLAVLIPVGLLAALGFTAAGAVRRHRRRVALQSV